MPKIAIIDIETTDTNISVAKIVEVGIVELDTVTGAKKTVFDMLCHERLEKKEDTLKIIENSWIVKNGFITVSEIRSSPQFKDIAPIIQSFINFYKSGVTAFNNAFDFGVLEFHGIVFPKKLACPMKLSTDIIKLPPTEKMVAAGRGKQFKPPSCEQAYKYYFSESDFVEKHRGADDAWHEADIVFRMIELGYFTL